MQRGRSGAAPLWAPGTDAVVPKPPPCCSGARQQNTETERGERVFAVPTSLQALCEVQSGETPQNSTPGVEGHQNSIPGVEGCKPLYPHREPRWFLPRHQPEMHSVYEIKLRMGTNFLFLREEVAAPVFLLSLRDTWKQQIIPLGVVYTTCQREPFIRGEGAKKE